MGVWRLAVGGVTYLFVGAQGDYQSCVCLGVGEKAVIVIYSCLWMREQSASNVELSERGLLPSCKYVAGQERYEYYMCICILRRAIGVICVWSYVHVSTRSYVFADG